MSWFEEQIKQRKQNDNDLFEDAFIDIAGSVMGRRVSEALKDSSRVAKHAIDEILKYYHIIPQDIPDNIKDVNEQIEYLMRPNGIMRRNVTLEKGWYKDAVGAMLAIEKESGRVVALIPGKVSGYTFFDVIKGKRVKINRKNEGNFDKEAVAFYQPFPLKTLKTIDFIKFIVKSIALSDIIMTIVATLLVALVGLLTPKLQRLLYGSIIETGSVTSLVALMGFMLSVIISIALIRIFKSLLLGRINSKLNLKVEAATMMRVLSLPTSFFKKYSSGELAMRTTAAQTLCEMIVNTILESGLTSVFSLVYITQIFKFAPALVWPSIGITIVSVVFSVTSALIQMRISKRQMELAAKESGMSYALISGVQKIKLSGSERRAFSKWAKIYAKSAELQYNPPTFIKLNSVITLIISLGGSLLMYYLSVVTNIELGDYIAFNASYGMISGAFASLAGMALTFAQIKPIMDMVQPLFDAEPEISEGKQVISKLSGGIEISNVTFRYSEKSPIIIDDLSLKIKPGQYVAIVGKTGCGKSTLLRLLLGFEKAERGAVYYDGKNINSIDLKSLRQRIGVVMQNGKLFQGDIYSNITISAPQLTMDEAWEAAELAGIADDIRNMPMGMYTLIAEGSGGISGGQKQRLMIARAIAPKPKILMFDEATSALDNITQRKVSESLDGLKCTRVIIAHRLSTIKQCDRIIVLDGGKIIEDGTYNELLSKKGFFAELVKRQMVENPDAADGVEE